MLFRKTENLTKEYNDFYVHSGLCVSVFSGLINLVFNKFLTCDPRSTVIATYCKGNVTQVCSVFCENRPKSALLFLQLHLRILLENDFLWS